MDLAERIQTVVTLDPAAVAVYFEDASIPWSAMGNTIRALDTELDRAGAREASEVVVVLRNRPEHLAAVLALLATKRCVVTVNPHAGDTRLARDVEELRGRPVIASGQDWARVSSARSITTTPALDLELTGNQARPVTPRTPCAEADWPKRPGVAIRMLTSGTTGSPKRVDLTYRALEQAFAAAAHYEQDNDGSARLRSGVPICWAPLVHISGLWGVLKAVTDGRANALLERFDVARWVTFVRRHRPAVSGLAPTAIRMVLDAGVPKEDMSSLRALIAGTAPTSAELVERFHETYGIPVLIVYGATEFAGAVAGWTRPDFERWWSEKRGSVGRAHPGVALRIVDPDSGVTLPPEQTGLLEVQAPQLDGVGGAAGDAWVRTTDLAHMDGDGFLFIDGRADGAIIRGGFKIQPDKIIDALRQHPAVLDAGVTGIADDRLGAVPVAAVELQPDGPNTPSENELLAFARERLAPYEVPRSVRVVDELPRTASLKVSQPELRALFSSLSPTVSGPPD